MMMEPETIIKENNEVCRLCADTLSPDSIHDVFDVSGSLKKPLIQLIQHYLNIQIDVQDNLPSVICSECCYKLIRFDEFAVKCGEVQEQLEFLRRVQVKFEYDDDKSHYENFKVKEEDCVSVKSEWLSDNLDDNDSGHIALSEYAKRGPRKRRSKSNNEKSISKIKKKKICTTETKQSVKVKKEKLNSDNTNKKESKNFRITSTNSFFSFVCHVCNESCLNFGTLNLHCLGKHNCKPKVKCICDKYLYTRKSVSIHFAKHDSSRGVKCEICGKLFTSKRTLETHSIKHGPKEEYPYICDQCPKRYLSPLALRNHKKTHSSSRESYLYPCSLCNAKFVCKDYVKTHISTVHEKNRPFICDVCGNGFASKVNLIDHLSRHIDMKLFNCTICSRKFKSKRLLRCHMQRHKKIKVKCPQCPAIIRDSSLQVHMLIHSDKFRYPCKICDKAFKRSKALKSHMNLHTGKRPYSCPWCPKTFVDNSNCRIHKKRKHPVELAEYESLYGVTYGLEKIDKDNVNSTNLLENSCDIMKNSELQDE